MIRKVVLRRFKRFEHVAFALPGNIVLAGPNNTGKTTLLQALAAWDLALRRWRELNDFERQDGEYLRAPISRPAFTAVPLRTFDLLWNQRQYEGPVEIEVLTTRDGAIAMEFLPDTSEQVFVRPKANTDPAVARALLVSTVFIPPMTGLSTEEPLYANRDFVDLKLAQARPGEVLRNILVEASNDDAAWAELRDSIKRLFGFTILPPDARGAHILAEYQMSETGPRFDIASAGSGFQQVLMLLSYLHTRPGSVLLLDEPDAHLHVILQDAIYSELRGVAAKKGSQLVVATHSEVVINAVEPAELCVVMNKPRILASEEEKRRLKEALGILTNTDIMLAQDAPGILYTEDYTDLDVIRAWAKVLNHPALPLLTTRLLWHKTSEGKATEHYKAMQLVRVDLPGLELLDGDGASKAPDTKILGQGLQRLRWKRYEVESYLLHPGAIDRFIEAQVGPGEASKAAKEAWRRALATMLGAVTRDFLDKPLDPPVLVESYLRTTKARTAILPPLLNAAGLHAFPYTRYHEIAALMTPDEVHPEVEEKLDAIVRAFRQ